jgi:archaellum component FlaG (FlaF/FlaG flagellin family)
MIFDIEINEPDQPSFKNTPKNLYFYIKSQKYENTGCFLLGCAYG